MDDIIYTQEDPFTKQVGGTHYKSLAIQPVEYIQANNIGYMEGNVIKYVTRWRAKAGVPDLEKAQHYLQMLIAFENAKVAEPPGFNGVTAADISSLFKPLCTEK